MTVVDADTHIAPMQGRFSVNNLIKQMERSQTDRALVWLTPIYSGTEIEAYLAHVAEACKSYPDKLIGFGWADPTLGVRHAKEMVRKCIEEYGFHGVKLNGAQNNFIIDSDDVAIPVVEEIARYGKPLALHIGPDAYENTHPLRAARIARMFPEMPVLMIHMGMNSEEMVGSVIREAKTCPNMTIIGSNTNPENVHRAIVDLGAHRVCYGSDHPFRMMHVCRAAATAMLDDLPETAAEAVLGKNILRVLQIEG